MDLQRALSLTVGWLADRRLPRFLRGPLYRGYARLYDVNLAEAQLPPAEYPSLGAFFVRRLAPGARPIASDTGVIVSPVDGTLASNGPVTRGALLQAKGRSYPVRELLGGVGAELDLEGAEHWTLYLSPRDYHRIHTPERGRLVEVRPIRGARHSVAPKVLLRRDVLAVNERVVLRLETGRGPLLLVLVGALNVGRIRVVGVDPLHDGPLHPPRELERGAELARFELGSTVVLIAPRGVLSALPHVVPPLHLSYGEPLAAYATLPAPVL